MPDDRIQVEGQDGELWRWSADEPVEQEHVLSLLRAERVPWALPGATGDRETGCHLQARPGARRQAAGGTDASTGDEVRPSPAGLEHRRDQADLDRAQLLEPAQTLDQVLQCFDPVAQPGCLFVAQALGEIGQPGPQAPQRPALEQALELLGTGERERAGCKGGSTAARDRAKVARRLGDDELLPAASEVEGPLSPATARVGRRVQLTDQA